MWPPKIDEERLRNKRKKDWERALSLFSVCSVIALSFYFPSSLSCFGVIDQSNKPGPRGGRLATSIAHIAPFLNSMLRFRLPDRRKEAKSDRSGMWPTSSARSN